MLKVSSRLSTAMLLAGLMLWSVTATAQNAPIKKVEQVFKRVERSMCQSLDLKNCKTAKLRKQRAEAVGKPPPLPRERPELKAKPSQKLEEAHQKSLEVISAKASETPPPKPVLRRLKNKPAAVPPAPIPAPVKTAALIKPQKPATEKPSRSTDCTARLAELGASFKPQATPVNQGHCSIPNPVKLFSVKSSGKPIEFSDAPVLSCEFAATLAGWTRDVAGPLVKATTKQPLVAVATGPGFDCRGRNGDGSGKMSEHASGNAVDIGTLKLGDGKVLNVKGSNATLVALRAAACESFTTVLGPGSNSAHEEHFHFDLAHRNNGYRVCN